MIGRWTKPTPPEVEGPKGFDDFDLRLGDLMRGERATMGKSLLDVQRELKIKAAYIAAIENADVSAFETQGFVAGYVRSYARYLGMEPDAAFARFCKEAKFEVAHGMSAAASSSVVTAARSRSTQEFRDPLANPNASFVPRGESLFAQVEPGAVGSFVVLVALIAALGYGGWSVLQEVQRVQLAPMDQAPTVVAEIDPLGNVSGAAPLVRSAPQVADAQAMQSGDPVPTQDQMDRITRREALDVPVMVARDGPIAAINPRVVTAPTTADAVTAAVAEALSEPDVQVVAEAKPGVELIAVRPSWVQVKTADGTVLFEKILDAGERWSVPMLEEPPLLRSGNSGSVYFAVNGQTYGPAAPGPQVVKNIALSPEAVTEKFAVADCTQDPDLSRMASATLDPASVPLCPAP
ncbi:MAG: helix-turn-helix domain-containing protein [Rhodobacteraceae bacterium]|nr:helix-turn-helix domain-containing protein [Paracoccaceae bacterium]